MCVPPGQQLSEIGQPPNMEPIPVPQKKAHPLLELPDAPSPVTPDLHQSSSRTHLLNILQVSLPEILEKSPVRTLLGTGPEVSQEFVRKPKQEIVQRPELEIVEELVLESEQEIVPELVQDEPEESKMAPLPSPSLMFDELLAVQ
jgi:hypothetical protein